MSCSDAIQAILAFITMIGIIVASFMTKWSVDKQNKLGLLERRTRICILLKRTLNNFNNCKAMMSFGDNGENDFLEGLCDQSMPLLYKMTGHKIVIEKSCTNSKIANSDIKNIADKYIFELEEAILQIDILFDGLKEKKYMKRFLLDYKKYLLNLLDYKLSSEYDDDLRAVADFYSFKDLYKNIVKSEEDIKKYCGGEGLNKIVNFISLNKDRSKNK